MELDRGLEIHTHLTLLEYLEPLLKKETFEAVVTELKTAHQHKFGNVQTIDDLDISDDEVDTDQGLRGHSIGQDEKLLDDLFFESADSSIEPETSPEQIPAAKCSVADNNLFDGECLLCVCFLCIKV